MNPRNDFMVAAPENLVQQGLTEYWQYKYIDAVINDKSIEITPLYNFINNIPDAESVVLKP